MHETDTLEKTRKKSWWWVLVVAVAVGGCTFDSTAGLEACEEGERRGGEVCRDDQWVALDGGAEVVGDTTPDAERADGADGCSASEERCNGEDDDCDGTVDEGCPCEYTDTSVGVCSDGTRNARGRCEPPGEYSDIEGVGPEQCDDGLDNDCDGKTDGGDSDCGCRDGEQRECYTGPAETADTGVCSSGRQVCEEGQWQRCADEQTPADSETCDDEMDNDCDGGVDEGCLCNYDGRDEGVCGDQMQNQQGVCPEPDTFEPATDVEARCDSRDNDCDGAVDEGCSCDYSGEADGVCGGQTRDAGGECREPDDYDGGPEAGELCDGRDNDCDGAVDEDDCECINGVTGSCYTGPAGTKDVGICEAGAHRCSGGEWTECNGEVTPEAGESCDNGRDEDCNGVPDNGCPCDYGGTARGVCGEATKDKNGDCEAPSDFESSETSCDDGLDNNCDGSADADDLNCRNPPGAGCSDDSECRGACEVGTCVHRIFATSTATDGDFGGLQGADGICGQRASSENLGGNWKAVLSVGGTSAKGRVTIQAPVQNMNGDKIADDASDLWDGDIDTAVGYDEQGGSVAGDVWTGTEWNGTPKRVDCAGWTSNSALTRGQEGRAGASDRRWLEDNDGLFDATECDDKLAVYCIEQP